MKQYRENGFPITIVRPSHTYDERSIPLGVHGSKGTWQVAKRMLENKPVIIHGDGTSLWTLTDLNDFIVIFLKRKNPCVARVLKYEAFGCHVSYFLADLKDS